MKLIYLFLPRLHQTFNSFTLHLLFSNFCWFQRFIPDGLRQGWVLDLWEGQQPESTGSLIGHLQLSSGQWGLPLFLPQYRPKIKGKRKIRWLVLKRRAVQTQDWLFSWALCQKQPLVPAFCLAHLILPPQLQGSSYVVPVYNPRIYCVRESTLLFLYISTLFKTLTLFFWRPVIVGILLEKLQR